MHFDICKEKQLQIIERLPPIGRILLEQAPPPLMPFSARAIAASDA